VTDFSVFEDEMYMALLKRRAYMTAFPGELAPVHGDVVMEVEFAPGQIVMSKYPEDDYEEPMSLVLYIGKKGSDLVGLEEAALAEFLRGFFGVENA
jgi:hypothetical protein